MRYLLDTNVLSRLRRGAGRRNPEVVPDPRPERDALIAATALVHRLTVVTRNVRDFAPMGVATVDPWEAGAGN